MKKPNGIGTAFVNKNVARLTLMLIPMSLMQITGVSAAEHVLTKKLKVNVYSSVFSQNPISGMITDSKGMPLPGVTIKIKGSQKGVSTDANGKFKLTLTDENATLVFACVGFKAKELVLKGQSTLNVSLEEETSNLDELIVVGYGVQRKSDITGAVTSIKGADLTKIGGSNAAEALQGKAPGVQISNQGGPGVAPLVFIRGLGTNGDASPLYVVDGMMVNSITFLSPNDISSMEILKDASATAIYGSRGATEGHQ